MPYLTAQQVTEVVNAAVAAGLGTPAARRALLSAVNQDFVNGSIVDNGTAPKLQLFADLAVLNPIEKLADGSVPLLDWLQRAGELARATQRMEADVFVKYEARVAAQASGQKLMTATDTLREVVNQEDIVHRDDMVDYSFLAAGARAGKSVAKLLVPRFENREPILQNDKPRRTLGTAWLLSDRLVITNHHVVNFRKQDEAAASDEDLHLQARHAIVKFDYDTADDAGEDVEVERLEAWDDDLDFAILRLRTPVPRTPLRIETRPVVFNAGIYVPLNIIQHPSGHPKRVALRNNLLTAADATSIRYFTDTLAGSSGSPVFDDSWKVIGLHRGATAVNGISFQGRSTAVVNVGTQITAILDHLGNHATALRQEISV